MAASALEVSRAEDCPYTLSIGCSSACSDGFYMAKRKLAKDIIFKKVNGEEKINMNSI